MDAFKLYIIPLVISCMVALGLTYWVRKWAIGHKFVPKIRDRDSHKNPTPRLGGVAITIAFWLNMLIFAVFDGSRLEFSEEKIIGIDQNLIGVIVGAIIIIATMFYDDIKGMKWGTKLFSQIAAACVVTGFGISVPWFNNPFGDLYNLQSTVFSIGDFAVSWGSLVVVLWIVLVMNVVNWLDGLDGLAGGIAIITVAALFLLSVSPRIDQPATAFVAIILIGSILGFMPFNFSSSKIFLGDTGSMFIGYMIAILAIISGGKVATASLVMGLPILDGLWVIGNRLIHKKSPFEPDRNHIHHRLMKAGLSSRQTVILLYVVSMVLGYMALSMGPEGKFWAGIWLALVMVGISIVLFLLEWWHTKNRVKNVR